MVDLVRSEFRAQHRFRTHSKRPRPGSRNPTGLVLVGRFHGQRTIDAAVPERLNHAVLNLRVDRRQQIVDHPMGAAQFADRRIQLDECWIADRERVEFGIECRLVLGDETACAGFTLGPTLCGLRGGRRVVRH